MNLLCLILATAPKTARKRRVAVGSVWTGKLQNDQMAEEQQGKTDVLKRDFFLFTTGCDPAGTVLGVPGSVVEGAVGG